MRRHEGGPGRGQRGVILIWVAMFLLIMMSFMSLGVDLSKLMATRTQLQNAADAAALAGASAVNPATGIIDADSAVVRAQFAAVENRAFIDGPQPVVVSASDVVVTDGDKVKVTTRREGATSIVTYVAQVLGITSLQMKATATAKAEPTGASLCGLVPIGVVPPPGGTFLTGCSPGYVLKVGGGAGSNGNFGGMDFPSCQAGPCGGMPATGSNTFRCLVHNGYCCQVSIGDQITSEPGNMSSFRKAVLDRFKDDTDQRQGICYDQYNGNGLRIIVVPVVSPFGSGRSTVTVLRFAAFFIKNIPGSGANSTLEGEFIYYVTPGTGGGSTNGAVAYSLKLVN